MNWIALKLLTIGFVLLAAGGASGQEPVPWKTGPALKLALDGNVGITWGERPAREGLVNLSRATGVAIFIDRRLDPEEKLDLKLADLSLQVVLERVAARLQGSVAVIGSVVYLGPTTTAAKLASIAALRREESRQNSAISARLLKSEPWRWAEPAEPRMLLAELATRGGVSVQNPELIPHDLWPAADWPPLPWTDRLTLVLAGFGLTFELAGDAIRLVPFPDKLVFEKLYTPRGEPAKTAADLAKQYPDAKITVAGGQLRIVAPAEDHDQIDRLLRGEKVRVSKTGPPQKRYSLTVERQAAGNVVKTVANQLGVEMKYDPSLTDKLRQSVSFVVKDVPLDELLEKTLKPLGLAYKLDDKTIEIIARE
ncbi:MAG: STN domain-containing protein [Pirellulaceae bacterium]|nr:STN domain-containing protein [Pirellulaceae bacterium]